MVIVHNDQLPLSPLACLPTAKGGQRPKGLPDLSTDPNCSFEQARAAYIALVKQTMPGVKPTDWRLAYMSRGAKTERTCANTLACSAYFFHTLNVQHNAADIVLSMDHHSIEDARSMQFFYDLADDKLIDRSIKDRRLSMLYPGGGSHIPPFITVFRLIDMGKIDEAQIVYTDVSTAAMERMFTYLDYWKRSGILKDVEVKEVDHGYRSEYVMTATYGGRDIAFVYSLINSPETGTKEFDESMWAPEEYVRGAGLVIFHDNLDFKKYVKYYGEQQLPMPLMTAEYHKLRTMQFVLGEEIAPNARSIHAGYYGCNEMYVDRDILKRQSIFHDFISVKSMKLTTENKSVVHERSSMHDPIIGGRRLAAVFQPQYSKRFAEYLSDPIAFIDKRNRENNR